MPDLSENVSEPTSRNHPDDPQWSPDEATLAAVDRWLAYRVWHSRVPGAQVAIGLGGGLIWNRAYGFAELERRTPLTTGHLFRIASHSKTFTATVIMLLVEQGRLRLDDPISGYIPELEDLPDYGTISVRDLLEHTGGVLRDGPDADYWQAGRSFPDRAELIELVRAGLKRQPGELFAYSNLGYSLLGLVIEQVTGTSYAEATAQLVIDPLGLSDTASEYLAERAGDYAAGYTGLTVGVRRQPLAHVDTHAMASATGFTSTAVDLVGYFSAHRLGDTRLLSDRSKRAQQRKINSADPDKPEGGGYGLGMVNDRVHDHRVIGHSGGYPGHITQTYLDPESGLIISVLTNSTDGPASSLATGVLRLLDRAKAEAAKTPAPAPGETALAHTGRYASRWGVIDLMALGGSLVAVHPTVWDPTESVDELTEEAPDRWLIARGNGFGSVNEPVTFTESGLRYGGMAMERFDDLPDRDDVLA